ncbi:MAG: GNAT family N-acetyltransferase [Ruminococcus sp.]|nr:GNAT family N-acetyltransferase [Ruminococcus sp.]
MNIRVMTIDDYEDVYALWLSCKGMGLNNLDDSKDGIDKFLQRNPETCFFAESDNKITGVIIVGNDSRRGYIYHIAVHHDCRHNGIATQLVNRAMSALKTIGINKTALVVFEKNITGNDFLEKIGFTVRNDLIYRNLSLTDMKRIDT